MANKDGGQSAINHLAKTLANSIKEISSKLDRIQNEVQNLKTGMGEGNNRLNQIEQDLEDMKSELIMDDTKEGYSILEEAIASLRVDHQNEGGGSQSDTAQKRKYKKKKK